MSDLKQNTTIDLFSNSASFNTNDFTKQDISRSADSENTFSRNLFSARNLYAQSERESESEKSSSVQSGGSTDSDITDDQRKIGNSTERDRERDNADRPGMAVQEKQSDQNTQEEPKLEKEVNEVEESKGVKSVSVQDTKTTDAVNSEQILKDVQDKSVGYDESNDSDEQVNAKLLIVSDGKETTGNPHVTGLSESIETAIDSEGDISVVTSDITDKSAQSTIDSEDATSVIASPGVNNSPESGKKLSPAEQITPELLANRKMQLLNKAEVKAMVSSPVADSVPNAEEAGVDDAVISSKSVNTAAMPIAQDKIKKPIENVSLLTTRPVEKDAEVSDKNHDDGNALSKLVARQFREADSRQVELQNAAIIESKNTAEKAELQQIQMHQMQAKQLERQAMQNLNITMPTANSDLAIADKNLTDNMFLSPRGGIVTAPVLNRPETGSNATINAPINAPILQQDADKAMAANIRWMTSEGVKNAVVNVTPSGMGPISVSLALEKDQMTISIVASQSATREALDSMIPRLREQLISQGSDSVRVDVSDGKSDNSSNGFVRQDHDRHNGSHGQSGVKDDVSSTEKSDESKVNDQSITATLSEGIVRIDEIKRSNRQFDIYV